MPFNTPVSQTPFGRNAGTTAPVSETFTTVSGELLVMGVSIPGSGSQEPDSISGHDGTFGWVNTGITVQSSTRQSASIWACVSSGTVGGSVTVTYTTSSGMVCNITRVTGAEIGASVGDSFRDVEGGSGYSNEMAPITGLTGDSLMMGFWYTNDNPTLTPENTELENEGWFYGGNRGLATDYAASGDATPTCAISSSKDWACQCCEIIEASDGTIVVLTGQEITSEQGTITAIGEAVISLTGQEITSEQGALIVSFPAIEILTGQEITSEQGVLTITGAALIALAGQEITSEQGSITVTGAANVPLVGQELTSEQGTITVDVGGTIITLTGQEITSEQGTITATGAASISLNGQEITSEQGIITVDVGGIVVALTGQEITSEQGVLIITGAATIALTGQELLSEQGVITVSIGESTPVIVFTAVKPQRIYSAVKPQRIYDAAKLLNIL